MDKRRRVGTAHREHHNLVRKRKEKKRGECRKYKRKELSFLFSHSPHLRYLVLFFLFSSFSLPSSPVQLSFTSPVDVSSLLLTFQGGFVGKSLLLSATTVSSPKKFVSITNWEPKDVNLEQRFDVPTSSSAEGEQGGEGKEKAVTQVGKEVTNLKITFPSSTDFYGRITLYKLDVLGKLSAPAAAAAASSSSTTESEASKSADASTSSPSPQ